MSFLCGFRKDERQQVYRRVRFSVSNSYGAYTDAGCFGKFWPKNVRHFFPDYLASGNVTKCEYNNRFYVRCVLTDFLCHYSKEKLSDNLSFVLSIEMEYSEVNTMPYWCTDFLTYHMFGYFTANLLVINCIIKELNILQKFICKDIIINLSKVNFCSKL